MAKGSMAKESMAKGPFHWPKDGVKIGAMAAIHHRLSAAQLMAFGESLRRHPPGGRSH